MLADLPSRVPFAQRCSLYTP
jgi:hypothetical protein